MRPDVVTTWAEPLGFHDQTLRADDGVGLRLVVGGPEDARRVVLLHGAPQFSYTWRRVLPELARRYRVVAPDLRGYGASDLAPRGHYALDRLVSDLDLVVRSALRSDDDQVLLVAHDWGGPIAWRWAEQAPERIRHHVSVNAPHLDAYLKELTTARQALRSWYVGVAQLPGIERLIERGRASALLWMMRSSSPPGVFTDDDLEVYRAALCRPGRVEAALAYYREAFRANAERLLHGRLRLGERRVMAPSTIVWGEGDRALAPTHPDAIRRWAARVEVRRLPGVSHWVPEEKPEAIVRAVVDGDRAG